MSTYAPPPPKNWRNKDNFLTTDKKKYSSVGTLMDEFERQQQIKYIKSKIRFHESVLRELYTEWRELANEEL